MVTYAKKQQLEYKQAIVTLTDKIAYFQESVGTHQEMIDLTKKLSREIDQYRVKVRQLLSEAELKDGQLEDLRMRLEHLEQRRGFSRVSERSSVLCPLLTSVVDAIVTVNW